ncbi:MAG: hypothetical protein KTR29_21650 [Rhodothermaceae bacterium]|nr:hypothetical protein [Rhodothermaceae bacterium]
MMRPVYTCIFLAVFLSGCVNGCEWRPGSVAVNRNIVDTLEKQYGIYEDLERNRNNQNNTCSVPFDDPDLNNVSVGGSAGAAPNRQQDATRWSEQISRQAGTGGTFTDPSSTVTSSGAPSTSSPTSRLLGDDGAGASTAGSASDGISGNFLGGGGNTTPLGNDAFASGNQPDNLNLDNPPRTFGSEENTVFTLTIRDIFPVNFSNIQLTHPTASSATVQTFGLAQLTMKDVRTNRLSAQPYDSVDVSIRYFLEQEANGVWTCKHRTVDITTNPINSRRNRNIRGGLPSNNTIIRW